MRCSSTGSGFLGQRAPFPRAKRRFARYRMINLPRQHRHLAAMMSIVSNQVSDKCNDIGFEESVCSDI